MPESDSRAAHEHSWESLRALEKPIDMELAGGK